LNHVAAGRGVEVIVAEAVGLKRIGRGDGERGVGEERGERRAGCAGGGGLANGDGGAGDGMAGGAEDDIVLARALGMRRWSSASDPSNVITAILFIIFPSLV
jgi:hypothetical protein